MSDQVPTPSRWLASLGAYGFEQQEPLILAALVTGDPLLLIGSSGTGKTFLLNSISEALGLDHRHYNASLISFDDLVGFPYPDEEKTSVRFLETPATIWSAESVLIDEISRCKPEHQNRFFSIVHERRVQGLPLERLRYRWAAMNPCSTDQSPGEHYLGAEPLDPALADRFAVILTVGDWDLLSHADRRLVADPAGEDAISKDTGGLRDALTTWQQGFALQLPRCPTRIVHYVCLLTTALGECGIRLSPRRTRLLSRTLLAAAIVAGVELNALANRDVEALFKRVVDASLPHRAWGEEPDADKIAAAHRLAWDGTMLEDGERWVHQFHLEPKLDRKAQLLLESCPDPETGTLAIEQLLANEPKPRAAAFALAAYPAAAAGRLPIGAEGVNDLGRLASDLLTVDGEVRWEHSRSQNNTHPDLAIYAALLNHLGEARRERARQLFYYCAVNKLDPANPRTLEREMNDCVKVFGEGVTT